MPTPLQFDENALWKQRYRAASIVAVQIARSNASRGLVTGTETGQYQLYAWDVSDGSLRRLTGRPEGTPFGVLSPDGRHVYYLQDSRGDEIGHFVRLPWEGGEVEDTTPGLPPYSAFGVSISRRGNLIGSVFSDDGGFHAMLLPVDEGGDIGTPRQLHQSPRMMFGPSLSHGGEMAVITSTERSAFQHNSLVAFDVATGYKTTELWEEGSALGAFGFSPLPGDLRLLATSTRSGVTRPFIWDLLTGA